MSAVLDTTVFIDALRADRRAVSFLEGLSEPAWASEVTRVEVMRGLRSTERSGAEHLFAVVRWRVVDELVARLAGDLGRRYRRSHATIDANDLVVAATSQVLGLPLATSNVKHYPMFRGLRVPY
jgi:predicted nucleic acid-binding protein